MVTKQFVLAGNAQVVVQNASGDHHLIRFTKSKFDPTRTFVWFKQSTSSVYVGELLENKNGKLFVVKTPKSISPDLGYHIRVVNFVLRVITGHQPLPVGYNIMHDGKCGKCRKLLTDPTSIQLGLGPYCAKHQ